MPAVCADSDDECDTTASVHYDEFDESADDDEEEDTSARVPSSVITVF